MEPFRYRAILAAAVMPLALMFGCQTNTGTAPDQPDAGARGFTPEIVAAPAGKTAPVPRPAPVPVPLPRTAPVPPPRAIAVSDKRAAGPQQIAALRARYRRPAAVDYPADNPFSEAKATLGKMLFFETALSSSRTYSCATCHGPTRSWADGLPLAIGETGQPLTLRTPTLIDIWTVPVLGWEGKFPDLESVAFAPILGVGNMNMPSDTEVVNRIAALPRYASAFAAAFGTPEVTRRKIELALATFERTIVAGEAPFDRWIMGEEDAIDAAAKRGFALFNGKANCAACHSGPSFTDGSFHDVGVATGDDIGRGRDFPQSEKLRYAFKTPTLRDVARRAPYMHDGSIASLPEVIALYDRGGIERPSRSDEIRPLHLSDQEKRDLLAFLDTLTATPAPAVSQAGPQPASQPASQPQQQQR